MIICGDMAVGKSAIFERVQKATFPEYSQSTMSSHFASKLMDCDREALERAQKQLVDQSQLKDNL